MQTFYLLLSLYSFYVIINVLKEISEVSVKSILRSMGIYNLFLIIKNTTFWLLRKAKNRGRITFKTQSGPFQDKINLLFTPSV